MDLKGLRVKEGESGCSLSLKVIPRAARTQIIGVEAGVLKIKVQAPPAEGAANEAVIELLAKWLRKPKSSIVLIKGEQSRHKVVRISDIKALDIVKAVENQV